MPQFDTFSFLSQLFWLFLSFIVLYLSLSYFILPSIAATLKVRQRKSNKNVVSDVVSTKAFDVSSSIQHSTHAAMLEELQAYSTSNDSVGIVADKLTLYEADYNEIATPLIVTDAWKSATLLLLKRQFIA